MQEPASKTQEKPNPLKVLWPDVKTEKGLADAVKAGAAAMAYVAFSYALGTALIIFAGQDVMGAFDGTAELVITLIVNVIAIGVACFLGWLIWKRQNLIAAGVGLTWIVLEVVMKLVTSPGRGIVIAVLALLFSIHGVRGALAAKAQR